MIQVNNLLFEYPDKKALDNVSFTIQESSVTALVGPNGSGKTTLLRCLAALSKPIEGSVIVNGANASEDPHAVHKQVGYLQDLFGLYDQLTVMQSLLFTAHSRIADEALISNAIELAVKRTYLDDLLNKKISSLSRGMRQRVGIAQAILHNPKILLLDEPASGLDPEARFALSKLLIELAEQGVTIIVSPHILAELEDYSTEMLVIQDGKIIEHRAVKAKYKSAETIVKVIAGELVSDQIEVVKNKTGVSELIINGNEIKISLDESVLKKSELLKFLIMNNWVIEEFAVFKLNLQDEYLKTLSGYKSKN